MAHRFTNGLGTIGRHGQVNASRQPPLQFRQQGFDPIHHLNHIGAGLALDIEQNGWCRTQPGRLAQVFGVAYNAGHITQAQCAIVFVGQNQGLVLFRRTELLVGIDGCRALRAIQIALGLVDVGGQNGRTYRRQRQALS